MMHAHDLAVDEPKSQSSKVKLDPNHTNHKHES